MNIIKYPKQEEWAEICQRPHLDITQLQATVNTVLSDVRTRGDEAVKEYEERFDHAVLTSLAVTEAEIDEAERLKAEAAGRPEPVAPEPVQPETEKHRKGLLWRNRKA